MIAAQIAAGLAYMNGPAMKQRIIHYDLKPANILFDQWGEVKITVGARVFSIYESLCAENVVCEDEVAVVPC